jgi:hypothetical protein
VKLKIITELLFTIPLILTLTKEKYLYSIIITLSIIIALIYHLSKEKKCLFLDSTFSTILVCTNLYYVYKADFKYPYFQLAMVALVAAFYFYFRAQKKNYNFNHSMWHVASMLITLFCVLAYI